LIYEYCEELSSIKICVKLGKPDESL
jgi:hypothetical protein